MPRIALFGGSFNPPHLAHQMICLWVLSTDQVDQVWLLPTCHHPFGKTMLPFEHREAMCRLAVAPFSSEQVSVSPVERDLPAPNRTLYTVQHLRDAFPDAQFRLVIGADNLAEKGDWHRFDEIERLAPPLVVGRHGFPTPQGSVVLPGISSTEIRRFISQGHDVAAQLPAPVWRYIQEHGLYRSHDH